jgi:hypothetical protein
MHIPLQTTGIAQPKISTTTVPQTQGPIREMSPRATSTHTISTCIGPGLQHHHQLPAQQQLRGSDTRVLQSIHQVLTYTQFLVVGNHIGGNQSAAARDVAEQAKRAAGLAAGVARLGLGGGDGGGHAARAACTKSNQSGTHRQWPHINLKHMYVIQPHWATGTTPCYPSSAESNVVQTHDTYRTWVAPGRTALCPCPSRWPDWHPRLPLLPHCRFHSHCRSQPHCRCGGRNPSPPGDCQYRHRVNDE